MFNSILDDANYIINAICYTKLEKDKIKAEAKRISDKAGRRERISDKEINWLNETRIMVRKSI